MKITDLSLEISNDLHPASYDVPALESIAIHGAVIAEISLDELACFEEFTCVPIVGEIRGGRWDGQRVEYLP